MSGITLVINIPCYNEERTLPLVLGELPQSIPGVSRIVVQVIDDGSRDRTAEVAWQHGAIVIRHKRNRGLGMAFKTGAESALALGADIMVNTDADNQYPSRFMSALVKPVLEGRADIVIGDRRPWAVPHFSPAKRLCQFLGNGITRRIAGVRVPDTVSGFRAYSREALLRINVITRFSYVLDTLVQASKKGLTVTSVPIVINPPTRRSRLFKTMFGHMVMSAANILRVYAVYEPFKTFLLMALVAIVPAAMLLVRFLVLFMVGQGNGHIQSLIISAIGFMLGGTLFSLGVLGNLVSINRRLIEDELYLRKKGQYRRARR